MATTLNAGTATGGAAISADTTGILQLQSGSTPTTAVTIDASQNVGIGTTTPFAIANKNLTVNGTSSAIQLGVSGTRVGQFYSQGTEVRIGSVTSLPMTFYTADTEQMRIDSSGLVLIGKTADSLSTAGARFATDYNSFTSTGIALYVNRQGSDGGAIEFRRSNATVGSISVTSSSTAYNTSSDYRLKENITPMQNALNVVQQLKPVTYNWKADGSAGQGFIAHELQAVVPDCVTGEKDGVDKDGNPEYQGIDTSFLVATLTAAIQEQQALITQLQADVQALKGVK